MIHLCFTMDPQEMGSVWRHLPFDRYVGLNGFFVDLAANYIGVKSVVFTNICLVSLNLWRPLRAINHNDIST